MKVFRLILLLLSIATIILGGLAIAGKIHVFIGIFSLLLLVCLLLVYLRKLNTPKR